MYYYFSVFKDHASGNTRETVIKDYIEEELFFELMKKFPELISCDDTIYAQPGFVMEMTNCKEKDLPDFMEGSKYVYFLDYNKKETDRPILKDYYKLSYIRWGRTIWAELNSGEKYIDLKLLYDLSKELGRNLITREYLIDEEYLEKLRISDENKKIKLDKEEQNVINSIEDQFRWFYIPTDNLEKIYEVLNIKPEIKEGDITTIIDEIQGDRKIGIANYLGKTIIYGMNVPYIIYPDLESYEKSDDNFTKDLFESLNKLSKTFGSAQYFEYNNADEQIASLAMSKKGKLVYAKFTSEGMGQEFFGTQKRTMEVDQKTILKTSKKLGMTPEDMLVGIMKQKMQIKYFEQANWFIESKMKLYSGH